MRSEVRARVNPPRAKPPAPALSTETDPISYFIFRTFQLTCSSIVYVVIICTLCGLGASIQGSFFGKFFGPALPKVAVNMYFVWLNLIQKLLVSNALTAFLAPYASAVFFVLPIIVATSVLTALLHNLRNRALLLNQLASVAQNFIYFVLPFAVFIWNYRLKMPMLDALAISSIVGVGSLLTLELTGPIVKNTIALAKLMITGILMGGGIFVKHILPKLIQGLQQVINYAQNLAGNLLDQFTNIQNVRANPHALLALPAPPMPVNPLAASLNSVRAAALDSQPNPLLPSAGAAPNNNPAITPIVPVPATINPAGPGGP